MRSDGSTAAQVRGNYRFQALPAGDYRLLLGNASSPETAAAYQLVLTAAATQPFALGTLAAPSPLVADGVPATGAGRMESKAAEDDYTFTISNTGALQLAWSCSSSYGYLSWLLLKPDGSTLYSSSTCGSVTLQNVPAGGYRIVVKPQYEYLGTYSTQRRDAVTRLPPIGSTYGSGRAMRFRTNSVKVALACALVVVSAGCTGQVHRSTAAPVTSTKPSVAPAPSNAVQVAAQVCPKVPVAAVSTFVTAVSAKTGQTPAVTGCRAVSNTAAAWGIKGSSKSDLLAISIFDRAFGAQCGLSSFGSRIQQLAIGSHQAAMVGRGAAGGLFLCWASSARRIVLMAVNTPPALSYASIKGPAVQLANALVSRL